jgi:hypothetical protein
MPGSEREGEAGVTARRRRVTGKSGVSVLALWAVAVSGCTERGRPPQETSDREKTTAASAKPPPKPRAPDPDVLPAAGEAPKDASDRARWALQVVQSDDGGLTDRWVDRRQAVERGLTLVDLSDDWAPFVFADAKAKDGRVLPNRYRAIFVGLANDRTDGDGQPLRAGERNYLEPYGIPPSLSVLRRRFLVDGASPCFATVDQQRLLAVSQIPVFGTATEKKERDREQQAATRLEAARAAAGVATLEELAATKPEFDKAVKDQRRVERERAAFAEAEKRLICEGLLDPQKHLAGRYDTLMRFAMLAFQQKNLVMAQGDITRATLEALARPPLQGNFLVLERVLAERVADAGRFLEDGSAEDASYSDEGGTKRPVPNLVGQGTTAVLKRLGIATPEDALAFFRRRARADFRQLVVAARLPEKPPYYADQMDLSVEIDRGDIWYEFPFDGKGRRLPQPRSRFPSFTLSVRWQDQNIPLVRWRTTVGGWRSELASDGQEYLRYKGSDVGARVIRHVVAAPVWLPPDSTPMGGFVKQKWVNGAVVSVPNHDEVGPGYLSAYGLVAGVHVEPRGQGERKFFFDNGIRTHGTFDYTSLRGRFSHGCHRLANHLAVRMFSFVLQHRRWRAIGPMPLDYRKTFVAAGGVYDLRLPSRGYYYELDPPMPVVTLPGTVKGTRTQPIAGYVSKPGVVYARKAPPAAPTDPEAKAGGGAGERDPGEGTTP